jgi:hypothetical protein
MREDIATQYRDQNSASSHFRPEAEREHSSIQATILLSISRTESGMIPSSRAPDQQSATHHQLKLLFHNESNIDPEGNRNRNFQKSAGNFTDTSNVSHNSNG